MESLKQLTEISAKSAPGISPEFLPAHVWKTFDLIRLTTLGRKRLAQELKLGEGTVRNLVNRLIEEGFVETSRSGMTLTLKGENFYEKLQKYLSGINFPFKEITVSLNNYAVRIKNGAEYIRKGIEQRDKALLVGAKGATTITYIDGRFNIPGMDRKLDEDVIKFFKNNLKLNKGDAIVIGSADKQIKAEIGAISAALDLYIRTN